MRYHLLLVLLFSLSQLHAQELVNLNPDPKGEPWYVGKLRELTKEDLKRIEQTPKLSLPLNYSKAILPSVVDNSLNKYFRPVFNQQNGSCGQASGVGYNFTYAINFTRDQASNTTQTQYPTHFTYNFLNGGADNGSFYFDGWEIINANGCPTVQEYGGTPWAGGLNRWMSGYNSYYEAMKNRVFEVFTIDVSTIQGLETLKAWMNDQLNGSPVGGLANFSGGVSDNFIVGSLPTGTPESGKKVITHWNSTVDHAMTFVGYNDNICYDFNGDGKYTNNVDIDRNGILDLRDFEVGGLIMVNSWGSSWGNSGKAYVPYKLLAEPNTNGGIGSRIVHVIRAKAFYEPKATIKATITHTSRGKLRITAGISANPNATKPDYTLQVPIFNFQGGDHYMKGETSEEDKTIEIGLDITPLFSYINSDQEARVFLYVEEKEVGTASNGTIVNYSVYSYINGANETICPQTNVNILNNDTTYLWVNKTFSYDKVGISTQIIPDAAKGFPYKYKLEAQNGTSPYKWSFIINFAEKLNSEDFTAVTNTALNISDNDDGDANIILPFSFPFYDSTYKNIKVTSDGSILFGNQFEYVRDNAGLIGTKAITVYGSDLMIYPADGDGIWYKSTNDSITIRWKTSKFENQSFNTEFSATLFPSGKIKFNYGNGITSTTDWVSGVSMGNGKSYTIASKSGTSSIPANQCIELSSTGFPEGLNINNLGEMTFTPKESDKTWPLTVMVTDLNKISSTKVMNLRSTDILKFSVDTLKYESSNSPDPWQDGKDITITNSYTQAVTINSIDWSGFGWSVSTNPLTFPYIIDAGASLPLNIKLKSNFNKSANNIVFDSLLVKTNNITYHLPIIIYPNIYSTPTYAIAFNVTNNLGAIANATISIENITGVLTTNVSGVASINLQNGNYSYTIKYSNHFSSSGTLVVNGSTQSINVFLHALDVNTDIEKSLVVYPNPFSNEITVDGIDNAQISIHNLIGNSIIKVDKPLGIYRIETKNLPKGIYFITIDDKKGKRLIRKLVKN